jgi:hypothetical protein
VIPAARHARQARAAAARQNVHGAAVNQAADGIMPDGRDLPWPVQWAPRRARGQRQPGQGLAADRPGGGEVRGQVGGHGADEDGVQVEVIADPALIGKNATPVTSGE